MTALEQRMYCGRVLDKLQMQGIKARGSSTGQSIWINKAEFDKLKDQLLFTKIDKNNYMIILTKKVIRKILEID